MPPSKPPRSSLSSSIRVLPDTDLDDVWDRFEVFEALHHSMQICNPMTNAQVDELLDALAGTGSPSGESHQLLDVACGYGEVLFRWGERADRDRNTVCATGIDLSPWMIQSAHAEARRRRGASDFEWVLGDAREFVPASVPDAVICIGAEWIWHDFNGTARAIAGQLDRGGVAVIGAARLHHRADPDQVAAERGRVDTIDDMQRMLEDNGLRPVHRIDPDDAGWDAYLARTAGAAAAWGRDHPGERADRWLEEQADWQVARERDRDIIGWSVWVADRRDVTA